MTMYRVKTNQASDNIYQIEADSEMGAMINWVVFCLDEWADGRGKDFGEIISVKKMRSPRISKK
ncbi:hypothetical protein G6700_05135 [Polynucleobacter paneuropaeus]|jgi:hypothetical protein|uniref:hypothetical protein n=1 Tax=Polynucleobacter sp. AP-Elch-400A-B2 TaxID=2576930 RepID=UPI001BFE91EE|nr:hypothetical protein [Polynucleobacter sp. AP-Elch-400A-B2]QWD17121.1 hypothetical protein G6700_05135 [Polynucleobacter paneuropaeus]QWE25518.1 hypothetical protein FD977_04565 [Polynucleobacter sp. AP-Elch-400A-B2]